MNRKRLLDLYRYHDHFVTRTAHIDTYSLYVLNETSSLLMGHFIFRDRAASFRVGGAKEECVKGNVFFGGGAGGACLWISIQFL